MTASGKIAVGVVALGACAAQAWQVPSWDARITEAGAIREWSDKTLYGHKGKTWCGHVQGMCVSSNAMYFSYHTQILKTDWYGRTLATVDTEPHGGDICIWNGRLYTGDVYRAKVEGEKNHARISVYDAETLALVGHYPIGGWSGAADGITCLDGVIYLGMGRASPPGNKCWYGKFDAKTLKPIGKPFIVDHGYDSTHGSQNLATDGTYFYSAHYCEDESANTPCFIVMDRDFNVVGRHVFGWRQGIDVVPGGKDGAVRFIYCTTINWMSAKVKPTLPVVALVQFAELKDGKISDITRHCIFPKPLDR